MPIYQIEGPGGKIFEIEGPPNAREEDLIAAAVAYDNPPEPGIMDKVQSYTTDIPTRLVKGALGGVEMATNLFGADNAVSEMLRGAQDGINEYLVSDTAKQNAKERAETLRGKGALETLGEVPGLLVDDPVLLFETLGTTLPTLGAAALTGGSSALVQGAATLGTGAVMGAGAVKGSIYDATKSEFMRAGADKEAAEAAASEAQSYAGENLDMIGLGAALGALASRTGLEPAMARSVAGRILGKSVAEGVGREGIETALKAAALQGVAKKGVIRSALGEGLTEAAQGGQEQFAGNLARRRAGFEGVDLMEGVGSAAALEGSLGGLLGGLGGVVERRVEANRETRGGFDKDIRETFDTLPGEPTDEQKAEAASRFTRWGINEKTAGTIVERISSAKRDLDRQEEELKARQAEATGERTADIDADVVASTPSVSGMPDVDQEEQAALVRAYKEDLGLTPETYIERYMAGEGRGDTDEDLAMQQYAANNAPEIEQAFAQQSSPAAPVTAPTITPAFAAQTLDSDAAIDAFADKFGIDREEAVDRLEQAAVSGIKYSRGRGRPAQTSADDGLFGNALPEQGKLDKREEMLQYRLEQAGMTPEQKIALQEEQTAAAAQRIAEQQARDEEQRTETLGDIEYALRAQAPENAVYRVDYDPTSNQPYRLVAERKLGEAKPEVILAAPTLQDFSDAVYGSMGELTPYIAEAPLSASAMVEPGTTETEPTVATSLVQEFTSEVDEARQAGLIDDNQRTELLRRLERPNAYSVTGKPLDPIAKGEADAIKAMEVFRNAEDATVRAEAEAALNEVNDRLRKAVQNGLLNPLRARLKSLSETRSDEILGTKVREQEARPVAEQARLQERLGKMSGQDTSEETSTAVAAEREIRDAQIDRKNAKVTKFKRSQGSRGVSAGVAGRVVNEIVAKWKSKVPVNVVQSVSDLPAELRKAVEADGATDANGLVGPDGVVYLIADNLQSEEAVRATLFHEGLGHVGLAKLFRDRLDEVLNTLYKANSSIRAATDAWLEANPDAYSGPNRVIRAVEEVLAERSEAGAIPQSVMQRLVAFVRDFARRLGFTLEVTDADVGAILSEAHRRVVKGDGKSVAMSGIRYIAGSRVPKYARPKTTKKTADALQADMANVSAGLRRTIKSQNTQAMAEGIGQAIKGHSLKAYVQGFKENWQGMKPASFKAILASLPTSGVLDWFGKELPVLNRVDTLVSEMVNMKANIIKSADEVAARLDQFVNTYGSGVLAAVQSTSRINEVAPDEFASMGEALKKHGVIELVEKRILQNSNNKAAARSLIDEIKLLTLTNKAFEANKGDLTRRTPALNDLLKQLGKLAIDPTKTSDQAAQLTEMVLRIRDVYKLWDALGEQKDGRQLYKDMRQFYKDMFEAELALLDERISQVADPEQAVRLRDMRAQLMREAVDPQEAKKAGDVFWDVDASLFQKDYFPFMREGEYWLRVKGDKKGTREREFYTFRTAKELNKAQQAVAKRLGVSANDSSVIATGDSLDMLREDFRNEDALMQKVFDIVKKAQSEFDVTKNLDLKEVTDAIYQTWLQTTPERSVRRRMMHSEEVTGYSADLLNHFSRQVTSYANQLSKMAYAGQVRNELKGAVENIADRPVDERRKLETVIREIGLRTEQEINPDPQGAVTNVLNRMSYFYYLTSASTALIQTTSIPIRVMPRLWSQYGFAKGTALWTKYMKVWKTLGVAKTEKVSTGWGDQLHAMMPSVLGSKFLNEKGPRGELLRKAAKVGMERNLLQTVTDTLVQNERETAKKQRTGVNRAFVHHAAQTGQAMGVLFNGMENLTRQMSYFMTFELAYDDYKAKNPKATDDEVFEHAVKEGTSVLRDTLGEFTSWERPRLAKGNWTRALFLFKMHAVIQTKFFVQNARAILFNVDGDRARAAKELTGVLMMAGMFGGLMGLPLYTAMAYALAEGFDDEDDEDVRRLMGLDPRVAYDSDIMFRQWVMENFNNPVIGDMTVGDMLVHGPISALTNTELASRTSLDLKNMWFREAVAGDSLSSTLIKTAIANIAGGQMAVNIIDGIDNMTDGDMEGGLKKMFPAFFRSWIAAAGMANEGVKDRKGNVIIPQDDIEAYDVGRALLGFRPMELARWQDYYITNSKNEKRINNEKKKILDRLEKGIREGDIATKQDLQAYIQEEVVPFNRTYPDPAFLITEKTIERSLSGRSETRDRTVAGMQFEKKTAARDYQQAKQFMPR